MPIMAKLFRLILAKYPQGGAVPSSITALGKYIGKSTLLLAARRRRLVPSCFDPEPKIRAKLLITASVNGLVCLLLILAFDWLAAASRRA